MILMCFLRNGGCRGHQEGCQIFIPGLNELVTSASGFAHNTKVLIVNIGIGLLHHRVQSGELGWLLKLEKPLKLIVSGTWHGVMIVESKSMLTMCKKTHDWCCPPVS